jgi:hypothetical protein
LALYLVAANYDEPAIMSYLERMEKEGIPVGVFHLIVSG